MKVRTAGGGTKKERSNRTETRKEKNYERKNLEKKNLK